jgi:PEP-CTERM motif
MRKSLWIIPSLLLLAAIVAPYAHADSYIVTFNILKESEPAPDPSFGVATLVASGELAGYLDFTFTPDVGAFIYNIAIPSFPTANTEPINLCEGCCGNVTDSPSCNGVVDFYFPGNSSTGGPSAYIIGGPDGDGGYGYAFTPTPDYYVYGTLEFTPVPEPGSGVLTLIGLGLFGLVIRKCIAQNLQQAT